MLLITLIVISLACVSPQNIIYNDLLRDQVNNNLFNYQFQQSNQMCIKELKRYFEDVLTTKKWALEMFDSISKIQSGLLSGNIIDLGYYDECIGIEKHAYTKHQNYTLYGKYCLVTIPVQKIAKKTNLIHLGRFRFLNNMSEIHPENKTASFTNLRLIRSICIPSSCNDSFFADIFQRIFNVSDAEVFNCQIKKSNKQYELTDWIMVGFLFFIFILVLLSTTLDIYFELSKQKKNQSIYFIFSILSNGRKLIKVKKNDNEFPRFISGIISLSLVWMSIEITYKTVSSSPLVNTFEILTVMKKVYSMTVLGVPVVLDSLLLINGMIMVYIIFTANNNEMKFNAIIIILFKFIRITVVIGVLLSIHLTIFRFAFDGPLWPIVLKMINNPCKKYWWSTLLYVQNYVNPTEECLKNSWFFSVEIQLIIITILLIYALRKWPTYILYILYILVILSILSSFLVSWIYKLDGLPPNELIDKMIVKNYYHNTYTIFGSWIVGIVLGYYVYKRKENKFNKILENNYINTLGWITSLLIMITVVYGPNNMFFHEYDRIESSIFLSFHRIAWSLSLSWIIYSCAIGKGGIINWFLSIPPFQLFSKLFNTYYLIMPSIQYIFMGTLRQSIYFNNKDTLLLSCGYIIFLIVISTIFSLMFESPLIAIEKMITKTVVQKTNGPKKIDESTENYHQRIFIK